MIYPVSFYQTQDGKEIYDNALKLFNKVMVAKTDQTPVCGGIASKPCQPKQIHYYTL